MLKYGNKELRNLEEQVGKNEHEKNRFTLSGTADATHPLPSWQ